jgi:membrane protein YqaA with SNARE-associated domain
MVQRYGRLTVALGALTPLPFSITCWCAGGLGMPLARFLPVSLLRVPRYVVYYLAIAYADQLASHLS